MSLITDERIRRISKRKSRVIDTRNTNAHKKVERLERSLRLNLQPILDDITNSRQHSSTIYYEYNKEVRDLFRSYVELIYRVGSFYTNLSNGTPPKQTDTDTEQINQLTDYATALFFRKIIWFADRELTIDKTNFFVQFQNKIMETFDSITDTPIKTLPKSINIDKQIDQVTRTIAYLTLNTAVIMKTRQLKNTGKQSIIHVAGRRRELKIRQIDTEIGTHVMWVTAGDEKVCWKYCEPLDGEIYDTGDSSSPIPVLSTHYNCRCRLMNMDGAGKEIYVDTEGNIVSEEI